MRTIISVFGLTFIAGSVLNTMKAYFLEEFINVMVREPWIFCVFSILSSIIIELFPVVIIFNMHKMFFAQIPIADPES